MKKNHAASFSIVAISVMLASTFISPSAQAATSTEITVYAHRIPASYWDPCFATSCRAGSGPGVAMYFELDDSSGNFIDSGFADENGYTFSGLESGVRYYLYPTNCYQCHGSTHDVLFQYWGDGSSDVPRSVRTGINYNAWFSCTNGCSGN